MQSSPPFWDSRRGTLAALLLLGIGAVLLLVANLAELGIWEPWEASALLVAMEYHTRGPWDPAVVATNPEAPGYSWAVPTLAGRPVPFSLLKVWLLQWTIPQGLYEGELRQVLGSLEARTRLPGALGVVLLLGGVFGWIRYRAGTLSALTCSLLFLSMPVVYFGAHHLGTEILALATISGALILWFEGAHARSLRSLALLAAGFALCATLAVLDWRAAGLVSILGPLGLLGVAEIPFVKQKPGRAEALVALILGFLPLVWFALPMLGGGEYAQRVQATALPHRLDLLLLFESVALFAAALILGRHTAVVRALRRPPLLLAMLVPVGVLCAMGWSFAEVNPTLLRQGEIQGNIPVLHYLFAQFIPQKSLAQEHFHFDLWVRQIGFGAFPVSALLPAGIAYLSLSTQPRLEEEPRAAHLVKLKRFALVWAFGAALVMVPLSGYDHYFYPGFLPLALGAGLMLGDVAFWREADRSRPLLFGLVGVVGIATILMLGKDLERYPYRFLELYTAFEPKLELPEAFSWGRSYKPLKYALILGLMVCCFGLVSWAAVTLGGLNRWRTRRGKSPAAAPADPPSQSAMLRQAHRKLAWRERHDPSLPAKLARVIEGPTWRAVVVTGMMMGCGVMFLWRYIPKATKHLSQRTLFDTYTELTKSTPETPLYRHLTGDQKASVYLNNTPQFGSNQEFLNAFESPKPLYAVIPRNRLAAVNAEVRRKTKGNVFVPNAQSHNLILVSNKKVPGGEDENFVAKHIFEAPPKQIQYEITYPNEQGEQVHARLDGQLEVLGYSLNREKSSKPPTYASGEEIELSLFFRVLRPVTGNQKLFVHIDTPGNRLHGDHYPLGGDFPTTYWLPGDVVRDVHAIKVEPYSKPGIYTLNFGFYIGDKRMSVTPPKAHDGQNRLTLGTIEVR